MVTELQSEQKELADFIRAGSQRGPQCFGSYFDDRGGSCALGAVYDAVYHLPRHGKLIPDHLERLFRGLGSDERAILELSLQGYSTQEIGERLGRAERSVRRVRERARALLERMRDEAAP